MEVILYSHKHLLVIEKLTGSRLGDVTEYNGMQFMAYFAFKDTTSRQVSKKNQKHLPWNGRWLDSANQIERNFDFVISESIGYGGKEIQPNTRLEYQGLVMSRFRRLPSTYDSKVWWYRKDCRLSIIFKRRYS